PPLLADYLKAAIKEAQRNYSSPLPNYRSSPSLVTQKNVFCFTLS
ncbi:MAG: hypothetical protein ACI9Y1_002910, partial [Lentisphaeria bacterium]